MDSKSYQPRLILKSDKTAAQNDQQTAIQPAVKTVDKKRSAKSNPSLVTKKLHQESKVETFQDLQGQISDVLISTLVNDMGFEKMSVAQTGTIRPLLDGKDLLLKSKTGSGKTIAFLLPTIQKMLDTKKTTRALIISPTRELALQIQTEAQNLTTNLGLSIGISIGGTNIQKERKAIMKGLDILIGTPGYLPLTKAFKRSF